MKVLLRTNNDIANERFLREAELASQLDHPYAAHVYGSGTESDADGRLLWIAMELVQGITLAEWLETRGPICACSALAAHADPLARTNSPSLRPERQRSAIGSSSGDSVDINDVQRYDFC